VWANRHIPMQMHTALPDFCPHCLKQGDGAFKSQRIQLQRVFELPLIGRIEAHLI